MTNEPLLLDRDGPVATLTLNRPDAMNALSRRLRSALAETLLNLENDPDIRVLIITGAGKAFCAGLDLKELGQTQGDNGLQEEISRHSPAEAIAAFSGPIIGAVNGPAITGGFELALACDILVASNQARFADTHARVGILPAWGLSQKLPRLIGIARAKELSLTGNFLSADQACAWGLVNQVVAPEQLLDVCRNLAKDMASVDPECLPAMKRLIDDGYGLALSDALNLEQDRAREWNSAITAGDIEARREAIRARGKAQSGS